MRKDLYLIDAFDGLVCIGVEFYAISSWSWFMDCVNKIIDLWAQEFHYRDVNLYGQTALYIYYI